MKKNSGLKPRLEINPNARGDEDFVKIVYGESTPPLPSIKIKSIYLDEKNYLLVINNGERIIAFKSKRHTRGHEGTKLFKILTLLFDFRYEMRGSKYIRRRSHEPQYFSLSNLAKNSGSRSISAVYRLIKRLNEFFSVNSVSIRIDRKNNTCALFIQKE